MKNPDRKKDGGDSMNNRGNYGIYKSSEKAPGIIYKFLRLFTVVHPGEALTVLLLFLNIFLIAGSYSILKPVKSGLILAKHSPEQEAYLYAVVAFLLIGVVKIFSYLSSKFPRQKLIATVTLFFISNLVLFYILKEAGLSLSILGIVFWIWLSIFNVFIIAQFWAFSNDIYTEEAGKRLFPIIMFGQSMGFYLGSESTSLLVKPSGPLTPFQLMLLAGVLLLFCIALTLVVNKREVKEFQKKARKKIEEKVYSEKTEVRPLEKGGGFRVVFKSRYLLLVAFVILALNYVNTTGQYMKSSVWTRAADKAAETAKIANTDDARLEYITKIDADFMKMQNLFAWLIQLFLVSRIFKWFGVRGAMLFLPFIAFGGYFFIGFGATFAIVKWTKIVENSTDYSLMNTVKQALFLVTSREAKYKAKAAIDTFFVRAGDVLHALTVFIGTTFLAFQLESIARINVVMAAIWIVLSFLVIREHKKLSSGFKKTNKP
jgi:AAA family ATP:ADP antiporter